jgi:hypothetical protein
MMAKCKKVMELMNIMAKLKSEKSNMCDEGLLPWLAMVLMKAFCHG